MTEGQFIVVEAETFTVIEEGVIFSNTRGTENCAYIPKSKIEYIKKGEKDKI